TPVAKLVSDGTKASRGVRMGLFRKLQMSDGIACQAVRATLQKNELRSALAQQRFHPLPFREEHRVVGTRRQRNIELCPAGRAGTGLLRRTCAWVQVPAVLVQIREDDARIRLERIEDAVSMVRVDVDVSDGLQPVAATQDLDGHAAVVEHTKSGGAVPRCVMQA